MKILFFDTETTGLADFNKRARDPAQPHIVEFAGIITDETGEVLQSDRLLSKPDGWTIPAESIAVHGITNTLAFQNGIPEREVAGHALTMVRSVDLLVAYNLMFDKFILRCALRRYDLMSDTDDLWWKELATSCPMLDMTPICNLPGGSRGPKFPKLAEAYQFAFGKPMEGAHGAMADATACKELFFWLRERSAAGS